MGRLIDLTGQQFGRFRVVGRAKDHKRGYPRWFCVCDCGNKRIHSSSNLRGGLVKSCGCRKADKSRERATKHGMCGTKVYKVWANMKNRCNNPNTRDYKDYGKRNITVCKEWTNSFEAFYKDMGDPPLGLTLDRIDNDGGYSSSNCRWATRYEQRMNQRCMK